MANVYLAEDEELGRRVAIKILNERYANDDLFIERFRREAKSAAGLSHPNIVSIYDRGEAEGTYYIAMEVIEGRSLKELILTHGALPIDTAIAYAKQLLEALRFAHHHGIIHRDIKPHNVLVSTGPQVKATAPRLKVTDFGIARHGASQMTEAGSIMGTAQYLSPEQARGAPVTAASDLYSAGVVLYEMLTGKVPFTGDSAIEIAMKHVNELPKPPSKLRPEIPPELDQVVLRSLAKDPADRYQTADEFIEDLERVESGLPISRATATAATALLAGAAIGEATAGAHGRGGDARGLPAGSGAAPAAAGVSARGAVRRAAEEAKALGAVGAGRAPDRGRRPRGLVGLQRDPGPARGVGASRRAQRRRPAAGSRRPADRERRARGEGGERVEHRGGGRLRHRPVPGCRHAGRQGVHGDDHGLERAEAGRGAQARRQDVRAGRRPAQRGQPRGQTEERLLGSATRPCRRADPEGRRGRGRGHGGRRQRLPGARADRGTGRGRPLAGGGDRASSRQPTSSSPSSSSRRARRPTASSSSRAQRPARTSTRARPSRSPSPRGRPR